MIQKKAALAAFFFAVKAYKIIPIGISDTLKEPLRPLDLHFD
mgnify:CR=1 FL=1